MLNAQTILMEPVSGDWCSKSHVFQWADGASQDRSLLVFQYAGQLPRQRDETLRLLLEWRISIVIQGLTKKSQLVSLSEQAIQWDIADKSRRKL